MAENSNPQPNNDQPKMPKFNVTWIYTIIIIALAILFFTGGGNALGGDSSASQTATYTQFKKYVAKGYAKSVVVIKPDNKLKMFVKPEHIRDVFQKTAQQVGPKPYVSVDYGSIDELGQYLDVMQQQGKIVDVSYDNNKDNFLTNIFFNFGPIILMVFLWVLLMRRWGGGGGGGVFNMGKSKAKMYEKADDMCVTFKDVAGQAGAKQEVEEIVEFLKQPEKYTELGGKIPKGVLLVGPPGTGKTLLAKAVAGEANVPFFSISGSDFVEMFVGVGASRVRDLFKEAAKVAPCIIFIDEIDTIGKSRDGSRFGGNDEREQTLNQLLAELDGFDPSKGVIVLGATNRPEVLDKALLRPGRFDRRITVDRPNMAGRLATLQVHTRNIHLAEDVNLEKIAQATAGCVGADLANLVNEAALRAVRKGRKAVNQNDLLVAFEVVIAGSEKKGTVITDEEKRIIAYHEVGHALVAAKQKNAQPVSKITIVPHTQGALGYTLHLPEEEKFLMSKEDILAEIRTLLAGRSSEEIVCNTMTSGAANDIERATEMARNLVARFGMCDEFDMMALGTIQSQYLDGGYSMTCAQETYAAADRETIKVIRQCHQEARQILENNRELLDKIAAYLLQKETITGQEMMAIIEGRDPETVDNYGATREDKPRAFRPSTPNIIEAPAKHINMVSEPIPMPDFDKPEEDKPAEDKPQGDKPAEE